MNLKGIMKIAVDMAMTIILLCLMSYSMIGEKQHEVIGISMFVLFILHHILNRNFLRNLFNRRYTTHRIFQTLLVILIFISMLGSMVSGIILSRYVFPQATIKGAGSMARKLHMLSAYWGFIFMSLHLGLHWAMICNMIKRMIPKTNLIIHKLSSIIGFGIALYGANALINRKIISNLFLKNMFVFFNPKEPILDFIFDYTSIMGFFIFFVFYIFKIQEKLSYRNITK